MLPAPVFFSVHFPDLQPAKEIKFQFLISHTQPPNSAMLSAQK